MRKWIPSLVGCETGVTVGVLCLFQPVENIPVMIYKPVEDLSEVLRRTLMPNSDPMAAFVFQIPVIVLLPGLVGGLGGFMVQEFSALVQRTAKRGTSNIARRHGSLRESPSATASATRWRIDSSWACFHE